MDSKTESVVKTKKRRPLKELLKTKKRRRPSSKKRTSTPSEPKTLKRVRRGVDFVSSPTAPSALSPASPSAPWPSAPWPSAPWPSALSSPSALSLPSPSAPWPSAPSDLRQLATRKRWAGTDKLRTRQNVDVSFVLQHMTPAAREAFHLYESETRKEMLSEFVNMPEFVELMEM